MERIYTIMLDNGASYQARGDEALELRRGDMCVVSREFFYDCGRVSAPGAVPQLLETAISPVARL